MEMKLTYKELAIVTSEVEAVINSRPLTYICKDEVEEVLTPSHYIVEVNYWTNRKTNLQSRHQRDKHCRKSIKKMETYK